MMSIGAKTWFAAKLGVSGAISAVVGAGLLYGAAPAAAVCAWHLPGSMTLIQDNNLQVVLTIDDHLAGQAKYAHVGGDDWTYGTGKGELRSNGQKWDFNVRWTDGPGKGLSNNYYGAFPADGGLSGQTTNSLGTTNSWTSSDRANCVEYRVPVGRPIEVPDDPPAVPPVAQPPVANPPAEQQSKAATITDDVDVYAEPGGVGTPGRTVEKGTIVTIVEWREDNWVKLADLGWVWGDFVKRR